MTGSIAKTSTKEASRPSSAGRFRTLRNEGNQNNEIGLPLTLLRLGPEHEAAVLEMGMYVGGEIAELAADRAAADRRRDRGPAGPPVADRLARGDRGGQGRAARGAARPTAPRSSTPTTRSSAGWPPGRSARSVTYGFAADADVGAEAVESAGLDGMRFVLRTDGARRPVTIPTLGRLSVHNALAARRGRARRRA